LRQCREDAGQRVDHADLDRLIAARGDDEGRGHLQRPDGGARLKDAPPAELRALYRLDHAASLTCS